PETLQLVLHESHPIYNILDIDNPNEEPVHTYWQTEDDAQKGVNAAYSSLYKEGTWMRWLSFRYDLSSDEGWSTSPWNELGDWTRFRSEERRVGKERRHYELTNSS